MHRRQFLGTLAALAADPAMAAMPLSVIATFSVLSDMATQIGGPTVAVNTLVGPDADVHTYQPRPGDLRALMGAELLVTNGLGLEGWLDRLTGAVTFKGTTVVAAQQVKPRTMIESGGVVATDPHAWQDPGNAVLYAEAIGAGLSTADPSRADTFRSAVQSYAARIKAMES